MDANLWVEYFLVIMKLDAKCWVVLISRIYGYTHHYYAKVPIMPSLLEEA